MKDGFCKGHYLVEFDPSIRRHEKKKESVAEIVTRIIISQAVIISRISEVIGSNPQK